MEFSLNYKNLNNLANLHIMLNSLVSIDSLFIVNCR